MATRFAAAVVFTVLAVAGCECGGPPVQTPPAHAVKGTVEGLAGSGLVLQNNGGDDLAIDKDGAFAFPTAIAQGTAYAVTVLSQPTQPSQTCAIEGASGTMGDADVTDLKVTCETNRYTIGGTITGLQGTGLALQNNDGDDLAIDADGAFTFPTPLSSGETFTVTVTSQPADPTQTCVVSGGSGTVVDGDVTTVTVNCATDTFTIGGTVSGLEGTGLQIDNNGAETITLAANGTFAFPTPIESGAPFAVTVKAQPTAPTQTCVVASGEGTVGAGNVTTVAITCTTNAYLVGGTISGLQGAGLVLQNNLGDNLMITADGAFTFATPVPSGQPYDVTVSVQPTSPWQTCTVTNGSGTIVDQEVSTVEVSCVTNAYAVGGTVTGLAGSGLTLQNNGGDDLTISADGTFSFLTPVESGAPFAVTIATQPTDPWQTCSVAGGTGTIGGADVTSITVNCTTNEYVVGGTVSGLAGTGLSVQLNGGAAVSLSANGTFAFPTPLPSNTAFAVTIATQPTMPWQTCTLANDTGTVTDADVTTVAITCVTNTYPVGGTVTGLLGGGLMLQNNGGDEIALSNDGAFQFPTVAESGQGYAVTISAQPTSPWQTCTVTSGSGSVTNGAVTTVAISCVTNTYTVGGTVSGLLGTLTLHDNGGDALVLNANGSFTFSTALESGDSYAVTVATQPATPSQTCTVSSSSGAITNANVTTVSVSCVTNTFAVGGTVSGLVGSGLVLTNNGGDPIAITQDGAFTFLIDVASGQPYDVQVQTQPATPYQTCVVSGGSGTIGGGAVSSVAVNCTTNTYTVGGTVTGMLAPGLQLANGAELLPVSADGTFAFPTPVASGGTYDVLVQSAPSSPAQTCVVTNGSGTVTNANVTTVEVTCTRNFYDLGVVVTGLSGSGLVLQNNNGDNLAIPNDGTFTFATQVGSGLAYSVTALSQPTSPWQTCTVNAPAGTMAGAPVILAVNCVTNTYTVGGIVTGAVGAGLTLTLNGGAPFAIPGNGAFTFPTAVASGAPYAVNVVSNPNNQLCAAANASGTIAGANVTNVAITCITFRPNLMQCGSSNRDIMTFVPSGASLTWQYGCTPDANTQALLVTRSGLSGVNAAVLQSYLNNGGILLTEFSTTASLFNMAFGTAVTDGPWVGSCYDTLPSVVQLSPGDPFWQANPFQAIGSAVTGCGYAIHNFPGLVPLAGWSATDVAVGYRNLGQGRFWATEFDWQDTNTTPMPYTESLMGYMITHRR